MGGYYGSPKTVLKNNKDLLGKKNRLTRKDYIGTKDVYTEDSTKATPELLEQIRKKAIKENRRNRNQQILFVILIVFAFILIFYEINKN